MIFLRGVGLVICFRGCSGWVCFKVSLESAVCGCLGGYVLEGVGVGMF